MNINKILIACYKGDFWQAKACVASIRYWYPEIKIELIKDELKGKFNTNEIEKSFNIGIFPMSRTKFGWGLSKLEPLFMLYSNERFLIVDADTIFIGPVLEVLNNSKADFIVSPEWNVSPQGEWFKRTYYNYTKLQELDSKFEFPGYTFNTGQFVACTGKISRESFDGLIDYSSSTVPQLLNNDVFSCADQGRLNYLLPLKQASGKIVLDTISFMIWSGNKEVLDSISLKSIKEKQGYPFIIHFAGRAKRPINMFDRNDIYKFFLMHYFKFQKFGLLKLIFLKFKLRLKYFRMR